MTFTAIRRIAPLLVLLLLAACAATSIDGTWIRPGFAGTRLAGSVFVVGVARDETVRRLYEDEMAARLAARGVKALRSYESVPGALDRDSHEKILAAARAAATAYLLSTAVIGQEVEQSVVQEPWPPAGFIGWHGWYRAYWGLSWPVRTEVRTYNVYIAQTALTRVDADRVEWTVRTRTSAPADVARETRAFVGVILGAMVRDGLLAAAN
jgi:hypothetical protein